MALAAANATYGSNHSVDNLVLHRAVILDETCDPILQATLNEDDGTLEFAAFTATADGDTRWTIAATADSTSFRRRRGGSTLRTLPSRSPRSTVTTSSSTPARGFDYGDAFRSIRL